MEFTMIEMRGEPIPIKCNLGVLEKIQKEFGSMDIFLRKIAPLTEGLEIDKSMFKKGWLPDVHAIAFALPILINEGIDMYNDEKANQIKKMDPQTIYRRCDMPVCDVSAMLYNEIAGTFTAPKQQPPAETSPQPETTATAQNSK